MALLRDPTAFEILILRRIAMQEAAAYAFGFIHCAKPPQMPAAAAAI